MSATFPGLLERFCRYCRLDTQAAENAATYPSTPGQLELGRLLVAELAELGLGATQSEFGIVTATLPPTVPHSAPTIAWFAHQDTSPETSGRGVNPQVLPNYHGRDLPLPNDATKVIRVADNPDLTKLVGQTIITTDGTTLLGADNKAGIAVILAAAQFLLSHPEIPRGPIKLVFTCDEEIGKGVDHIDVPALGAVVGYTLDGAGAGEIEGNTFSANRATVTITGVNIHPSVGKGRMVNAVRLAGKFLERLPQRALSPETTEGAEGFLHPYTIEGGVASVTLNILLRDFETAKLAEQAELLRSVGRLIEVEFPQAKVTVETKAQYRNMADGLTSEPRALKFAEEAMRRAGLTPHFPMLRGGTDGALLTARGLPTPNLSTGEHNPHSPLEWTCLEEMETAARVLVELAQVWAGETA